jgi:hypothetical protein
MALYLAISSRPFRIGCLRQRIQLVAAKIVRPPLHVANAQRPQQRLQKRNVLEEKLLLQVLRPGRDNHPLPRTQRRQQIRQRLPRPRPRLDDQVTLLVESALDRLRHLQLALAKLIRQRATNATKARPAQRKSIPALLPVWKNRSRPACRLERQTHCGGFCSCCGLSVPCG